MSARVLVTGADGFIGSHLTESLVRAGYDVVAFTWYNSFGSLGWLDTVDDEVRDALTIFVGDVRDAAAVTQAVRGAEQVFHLAALIGIPYSYIAPQSYVDTNVTGTLNLLLAARDNDVRRFLHTSTSEVYGSAQYVPINERHPLVGQSPYSASKIAADQLALSFERSFDLPVTVVRPFNTYGPRQSTRAVIPTVIQQLLAGQQRLKLGSLSPTRDFSYVTDTVAGFIAVAQCDSAIGDVLNLGSGFEVSVGDTVHLIASIIGADVDVEQEDARVRPQRSEVERLLADNSAVRQLTGWEPKYSGLDGFRHGLERTVEWFRSVPMRPRVADRYTV